MVEICLKWFACTKKVVEGADEVGRSSSMESLKREKGRQKRTLNEVVEQDLLVNNISKDLIV